MTELELLHSFLQVQLMEAEKTMVQIHERMATLNEIRRRVEDAIAREKRKADPQPADPQP